VVSSISARGPLSISSSFSTVDDNAVSIHLAARNLPVGCDSTWSNTQL
jgi:hypothetical protein